jgi:hypothetical protein
MSAYDPKRTLAAAFRGEAQLHITAPRFGLKCCAKDIYPYGSAICAALVCARSTLFVAGALGGVGAGKSSPIFDLGTMGNIISGLIGGGVLGQIVTLLLPSVVAAAQSGNLSIGGIASQVIAGGAGGAILTCNQEQSCRLTVNPKSLIRSSNRGGRDTDRARTVAERLLIFHSLKGIPTREFPRCVTTAFKP